MDRNSSRNIFDTLEHIVAIVWLVSHCVGVLAILRVVSPEVWGASVVLAVIFSGWVFAEDPDFFPPRYDVPTKTKEIEIRIKRHTFGK